LLTARGQNLNESIRGARIHKMYLSLSFHLILFSDQKFNVVFTWMVFEGDVLLYLLLLYLIQSERLELINVVYFTRYTERLPECRLFPELPCGEGTCCLFL
jgi:hypothetical protein